MSLPRAFDHVSLGQRVRFGAGRVAENLADEVRRHDARSVMVISGGRGQEVAAESTRHIDVALHYTDIAPHVPVDKAVAARAAAADRGIDLVISIGGGSTTGLAKAVALTSGLPVIAVPTTYSGSEATNVWGLTENSRKTTGVDDRVLPSAVVYDAELTVSLPVELSVASGLNALAHCVDALWGPRQDPINMVLAVEGIRSLATGLPAVVADPTDTAGRDNALLGAYLSAVAFTSAGSGMHHKICHVLGGSYNMPHAQTHAVVLPHVLAYNAPAAPAAAERIAGALGHEDAVDGLERLRERLGAPAALRAYGLSADQLDEAADLVLPVIPASNPRLVTRENARALLSAAWSGNAPTKQE